MCRTGHIDITLNEFSDFFLSQPPHTRQAERNVTAWWEVVTSIKRDHFAIEIQMASVYYTTEALYVNIDFA